MELVLIFLIIGLSLYIGYLLGKTITEKEVEDLMAELEELLENLAREHGFNVLIEKLGTRAENVSPRRTRSRKTSLEKAREERKNRRWPKP